MVMSQLSPTARVAHDLHERFTEGKLESCLDAATDDIEVVFQAVGQSYRGREGFLQFMQGFRVAFPDLRIRWIHHVANGDEVVAECAWTGTHNGPLVSPSGTIPPTGKKVTDGRFCEVIKVRDGKIARIVNYQDLSSWLRQLGLAQ
jgi:steroid delta-isomerase-like uncharacterized protein